MLRLERRSEKRTAGFTAPSRRIPSTVAHICGLALAVISPGLLIAAIVEFIGFGDGGPMLLLCSAIFAVVGGALWFSTRLGDLAPRTVFAAVAWSWVLVSVMGALPFILTRTFQSGASTVWIEIADAVFESTSGYTCTGSTVLTTLPDLHDPNPRVGQGVLFYRQLTQWYGGMGFVQLVVTVLPALGRRAMGFIGAEAPGPTADRIAPRAKDTARLLWQVYIGATLLMTAGYTAAGMSLYDGFTHSLTTAATGGFSTYNDSLGEFDSVPIEIVAIVAMMIGGTNFALHWLFLARDRAVYAKDHEFRAFVAMIVAAIGAVTAMLLIGGEIGGDLGPTMRTAVFNVVSLGTSTGFGNAQGAGTAGDFVTWGAGPLIVLLILMTVGGMSGSTAGGVKVIRIRVLGAHVHRLVARSRQPRSVIPLRLGSNIVPDTVAHKIAVYGMAWLAMLVGGLLAVTALGAELEEALSAVIGSLSNMGPALGAAGPTATFQDAFSTPARLVLAFLMIAGRLELIAVLLMFAAPRRSLRKIRPHKHTF